jgi:Ca2+/Na+ antiporter
MDKHEWIRDLVFYIIALCFLVYFGMSETITYTKAILFLMIYVVYIGVIIYVSQDLSLTC